MLEFAIPYTLIATSERWIPSSLAGILICAVPLIMIALARPFGVRERVGARRLAGLLLGIFGVSTLLGFGVITGTHGWTGIACMCVVTVCYAAGPLVVQRYLRTVDSIGALAASLIVASLALVVPAALTLPHRLPGALALASVAILGLLCTAVSMLAMFYLIKRAGAPRTAVVAYINPLVATAVGVRVLHERLGWSGPLGLAIILLSVWLASAQSDSEALPVSEAA